MVIWRGGFYRQLHLFRKAHNKNSTFKSNGEAESHQDVTIGVTNSQMTRTIGWTLKTIIRLFRCANQTVQGSDHPISWSLRVTNSLEDRHLRTLHMRIRFLTLTSTASTASTVWVQEVWLFGGDIGICRDQKTESVLFRQILTAPSHSNQASYRWWSSSCSGNGKGCFFN